MSFFQGEALFYSHGLGYIEIDIRARNKRLCNEATALWVKQQGGCMSNTAIVRKGTRSIRHVSLLTVFLISLVGWLPSSRTSVWASLPALTAAEQHLDEVMDKYHLAFDVYTDVGSGGNHFVHRAMMGSHVTIDDSASQIVHTGTTAISNTFSGRGTDWGGWSFQNGYMTDDGILHENWGTIPDAGYDLEGATKITFWARGAVGGERVEFFAFGVGRLADSGDAINPYPDSEAKVTMCGRLVSPLWRCKRHARRRLAAGTGARTGPLRILP